MCLFLLRLVKHLSIYLLVLLPLELIGAVIGGLYLFFTPLHKGALPKWLNWYNNYHDEYPGEQWELYNWLFFRNPLNMFQYTYLGYTCPSWTLPTYVSYGGRGKKDWPHVRDSAVVIGSPVGDGLREGFQYIEYQHYWHCTLLNPRAHITAYSYYFIWKYTIQGVNKCVRFRLGHKLDEKPVPGKTYQWVLTFSPGTTYTGE